jgi:hypothetical protein
MPEDDGRNQQPLRRVSSLVLNSPGVPASDTRKEPNSDRKPSGTRRLKAADSRTYEIVPDSEEERLR